MRATEGPRVRCIALGLHFNTAGRALDYQQGAAAKAAQQQCATGTTALMGLAMRMNALRQGPATEHPAQEPRSPRSTEPQTPATHMHLHADADATSKRRRTPRYMLCQQTR